MGKVTVYCQVSTSFIFVAYPVNHTLIRSWNISGCSPGVSRATWWYDVGMEGFLDTEGVVGEGDPKAGPLLEQALRLLVSEDEEGQDAITVIGIFDEDGNLPHEGREVAKEEVIKIPDSKICIRPAFVDIEFWDFGAVRPLGDNPDNDLCTVSSGGTLMVQNTSLEILCLATNGRLTPQRFWRLAMACGRGLDIVENIDYGEMHRLDVWQQEPSVVPGMAVDQVLALEELGDVDKIQDAILHQGCFGVWMRPDRSVICTMCVSESPQPNV